MSGVNWMRAEAPWIARASARASVVLPMPGTSSSSRWPPAASVMTASSMASRLHESVRSRASMSVERSRAASEGRRRRAESGVAIPSDQWCDAPLPHRSLGFGGCAFLGTRARARRMPSRYAKMDSLAWRAPPPSRHSGR